MEEDHIKTRGDVFEVIRGSPIDLINIQGLIPTTSTVPANTPTRLRDQTVIYYLSGTISANSYLYMYDNTNTSWRFLKFNG